ncbi:hypothetical protein EIP86_002774 [Pleurotus ostreatoroseus]|nr:hypothetical protein EIP86_002774 [Pleurotus ostreatoroseus]
MDEYDEEGDLDLQGRFKPRDKDLFVRWQGFREEVHYIKQHSAPKEVVLRLDDDTPVGSEPVTVTQYKVNSPRKLKAFLTNWRLEPCWFDLGTLFQYVENVDACLAQNPEPRFQALRFTDLPTELIHHKMGYMEEEDCRMLGLCSRWLREASISHVYKRIVVKVSVDKDVWTGYYQFETDEERTEYMRQNIDLACKKFTQRLITIRDSTDILPRIRSLVIPNEVLDQDISIFTRITHEELFQRLGPLIEPVKEIITRSPGLEECSISGFPLNATLLSTILSIPSLIAINLRNCIIAADHTQIPQCDTVLNVSLTPESFEYISTWNILPLFTSLRWLSIDRAGGRSELPPLVIRSADNVFATLERLMLAEIPFEEIGALTHWIRQARTPSGPGLRLTHFKLDMRYGIDEEECLSIISALQGAPMQVFVIDGIGVAAPALFDALANAFPQLESLTLIYRESDRQTISREAEWPYATWEYAPHFAGFTRLKHFGWNWKFDPMESTPSCLTLFESDFTERWQPDISILDEYFNDWDSIPRLFYAYCPTLESSHFLIKGMALLRYRIRRVDGKGVQVEDLNSTLYSGNDYGAEHNPVRWVGWPRFTQKRRT